MKATAVIGAGFGDCGKGLITDFLAADLPKPIVVRHNGGAQAGHTVERPDGLRHVFSHVGAGYFAGAPTYLARTFLVNPLIWRKEFAELGKVSIPLTYVDPGAVFTTPYDMLVNREFERHRGTARHGSCGIGINETVTRSATLPGHVGKAESSLWLNDFLRVARDYSLERVKSEVAHPSEEFMERMWSEEVRDDFIQAMSEFLSWSVFSDGLPKKCESIIFEGAQGLLLDEKHEFFPHVTRSRTGLTNVVTCARRNGIHELDVVYVTRAYMTRHGVGPFPTEDPELFYPDKTNVLNEFQGGLRFGKLDMDLIVPAIDRDLKEASDMGMYLNPCLAVTCLDQVSSEEARNIFLSLTGTGLRIRFMSNGPCRENVETK